MRRAVVAMFILGVAAALSIAAGGQLTGGSGLTHVVHDGTCSGSGTTGSPLSCAGSGGGSGSSVPISRQIIAGTGLSGGGDLSADRTLSLANTAVTPGTYTYATLTLDAQGRTTAASSGATPALASTSIIAGTGLSGGGDLSTNRTVSIATTGVSAATYVLPTLTLNAQGQATSATQATLSGDITTSAGSLATTIASNVVTNAKLAQMATSTLKGNNTGGTANATDLTTTQVVTMLASQIAAQLTAGSGYFGDGNMGTATFDGSGAVTGTTRTGSTYKANQDLYFTTCTFSASVVLDLANGTCGFGLYCNNTLAGPGSGTVTIQANGNAGSGGTGGAALTTGSPLGCTSGLGASGIQNAGQAGGVATTWQNSFKSGNGGASGASATNAGASGGTVGTTLTDAQASTGDYPVTWWARVINGTGYTILSGGGGGASGGGTTGIAAGGGGGGGGGYCRVAARAITNASAFTLSATGGRGSDGVAALGSNAGGGGGGGGGDVLLRYGGSTAPAGITITAAGGGGGSPQGTGNAGSSGTAGQTRTYLLGLSN